MAENTTKDIWNDDDGAKEPPKKRRMLRKLLLFLLGRQVAGLVWLWVLAFLFVWWTFSPPHIALFRDPLTGLYGIP